MTKLAPKRYRPFKIIKAISPVAYQLALPATWKIHDVFHVSLLSPYRETTAHGPNYSRPPPDLINDEEQYKVQAIRSHRRHGRSRQLQYLIKWKGYPESDNTWEWESQVHTPDLVRSYHKKRPTEAIKLIIHSPTMRCLSSSTSPSSPGNNTTPSPSASPPPNTPHNPNPPASQTSLSAPTPSTPSNTGPFAAFPTV